MASSFPPDVIIVDADSLIHARFQSGKRNPQLVHLQQERLPAGVFGPAVVSPTIQNGPSLAEAIGKLKTRAGKLERASVLLPDAWFRMHLSDVSELPSRPEEAQEMVRWTLKRSLPMRPEELRIAYQAISRANGSVKVMVLAAIEKTLSHVEQLFRDNEVQISLIEPIGLNIWNAVAVRETLTTADRLFFYFRKNDFTTAVFRGATPLFVRSRNLSTERSLLQEIRLSASYLRANMQWERVERCFVAGNQADQVLMDAIGQEFGAPVKRIQLQDFADWSNDLNVEGCEAELTACTGVFTK